MDGVLLVMSAFLVLFTVFFLVAILGARLRLKRSERLIEEMMRDYEQAYAQNPDDGFLRDNIIELRDHRWRKHEKEKK